MHSLSRNEIGKYSFWSLQLFAVMAFVFLFKFNIANAEELYFEIYESADEYCYTEEQDYSAELTQATTEILPIQFEGKYLQTDARAMCALVNEFRTSGSAWYWNSDNTTKTYTGSLSALTYDYDLEKVAMQRCAETAIYWSHTRANGSSCFTAVTESGYVSTRRGENIAYGSAWYYDYKSIFDLWKEENENYSGQGHRRNMLIAGYNRIGISGFEYNGIAYWVMVLAISDNVSTITTANDSNTVVNVDLYEGYIQSREIKAASDSVTIDVGAAVDIPKLVTTLNVAGKSKPVTPSYTYSVVDTSVAKVENGKIYGLKDGETMLNISAYGASTSVKITVEKGAPAEINPKIAGVSLGVLDNIDGDFVVYVDIPEEKFNYSGVIITQTDENGEVVLNMTLPYYMFSLVEKGDECNRYRTHYLLDITQMNHKLVVKLYYNNSEIDRLTTSVTEYLTKIANGNTKFSSFAVAMLNYGTAAQNYFGIDIAHPMNSGLSETAKDMSILPSNTFEGYNSYGFVSYQGGNRVEGIEYIGTSLVLNYLADFCIRHYVIIDSDKYDNVKFNYTLSSGNGFYYVDLPIKLSGILKNPLIIRDKTNSQCASTINCSVYAYMNAVFSNPDSDENLKILLSALCRMENAYMDAML